MHVTIIGGAGTIGTTAAFALRTSGLDADLLLVDTDIDAARGHAIDLTHGGYEAAITGTVEAAPLCPEAIENTDCVVVSASVPRPAGGDRRGGRRTFLPDNEAVVTAVADCLSDIAPVPVVAVTNPLDYVTHRLWEGTGWDRSRFVGYSLSESARAAYQISEIRTVPYHSVRCPTMGEHGEHVVPVLSRATIDDEPVSLSTSERDAVLEYVRTVPYDVMRLRGAMDSSRWVTGRGVARVVSAILDGSDETLCLSTPLDGEYGVGGVSMSVPVSLSVDGVSAIHEWSLSEWEHDRLLEAADSVQELLDSGSE